MPPNVSYIFDESMQSEAKENCFSLSDGKLSVQGIPILTEVPLNIVLSSFSSVCTSDTSAFPSVAANAHKGSFIGIHGENPCSRVLNPLGKLRDTKFMSIFRFKIWWSTMWLGRNGSDLQMETQLVLLDIEDLKSYVLILPIIEGKFRSALHPGSDDNIDVAVESGSSLVQALNFESCVYLHTSDNPYDLMREAYTAIRVHLGTFKLLEEKTVPNIIDKFGWCTWDAFYLTVDPVGVWQGVKDLVDGGCPPRFLIIDDGWQSINLDNQNPLEDRKDLVLGGTQMTCRMYRFEECDKFKKYKAGTMRRPDAPKFDKDKLKKIIELAIIAERAEKEKLAKNSNSNNVVIAEVESHHEDNCCDVSLNNNLKQECGECNSICLPKTTETKAFAHDDVRNNSIVNDEPINGEMGLKAFLDDLREEFKGLDDVYVWHALCGAWGGVRPGTTHLDAKVIPTTLSPGLSSMMQDLAQDKVAEGGLGLVHPDQAADLYNSMHSYLSGAGITGVKVDVFHTLELVSEEYGGRVDLAKAYYEGLDESLVKNFRGNGLIASMEQCNDFFFLGTKQISMGRVGDDFWFQDPNGDPMGAYWLQGVHMIHCGYNSLWMGNFIHPDWDMFQSDHVCAKFHAASRAICGGPIYVSDSVGGHDFDLLKKVVLPDGTILRCQHYALPTRDCIFTDPLHDGISMLKLWNLNKFGGVIGAFNCQGAGWCPQERKIKAYPHFYEPICGFVSPKDVEWSQKHEAAAMGNAEEYAVYLNQSNTLLIMKSEKFSRLPITLQPSSFELFTIVPVQTMSSTVKFAPIGLLNMYNSGGAIEGVSYGEDWVKVEVKGSGKFCAYASEKPMACKLNGEEVGVEWILGINSYDKGNCSRLLIDFPWIEGGLSTLHLVFSST
eukprot:Gb_07183 [translate_table: standard]